MPEEIWSPNSDKNPTASCTRSLSLETHRTLPIYPPQWPFRRQVRGNIIRGEHGRAGLGWNV